MLGGVQLSWLQSHEATAEIPQLVPYFLLPSPVLSHLERGQTVHFQQCKEIPLSSCHLQDNHKTPGRKPKPFPYQHTALLAPLVSTAKELGRGQRTEPAVFLVLQLPGKMKTRQFSIWGRLNHCFSGFLVLCLE